MSSSTGSNPWHPPTAAPAVVNVVMVNDIMQPNFATSIDVLHEPKSQQAYSAAVNRNGTPYLYDPSGTDKNQLRTLIRHAVLHGTDLTRQDLPLFKTVGNETLKLEVVVKFYVTHDKDLDNMCKFLFDTLQGVFYHNDRSIHELCAKKYLVQHENYARTELYISHCAL